MWDTFCALYCSNFSYEPSVGHGIVLLYGTVRALSFFSKWKWVKCRGPEAKSPPRSFRGIPIVPCVELPPSNMRNYRLPSRAIYLGKSSNKVLIVQQ